MYEPHRAFDLEHLFDNDIICVEQWGTGDERLLLSEEALGVKYARRARRQEFAAGRTCARAALAHLRVDIGALMPDLDRAPRWPTGVVGSISHTAGYCLAIVGRSERWVGLGVDVEHMSSVGPEIWPEIMGEGELERLSDLDPTRAQAFAAALFCTKEAFFKFQFPALHRWLEFKDVEVTVSGNNISAQVLPAAASGSEFDSAEGRILEKAGVMVSAVAKPRAPVVQMANFRRWRRCKVDGTR